MRNRKAGERRTVLCRRNLNTGEGPFGSKTAIATGHIHHKPRALSWVVLPVQ
jgi:hypothetical protein